MGTIQIDGSTPKLTIGNATAEDATILFDGNAQDFYIALDDSADDLLIGLGSTVGTTPAISINSDRDVTISDGAIDFDVASHDTSNGLKLGGTLVTATAAELNIMDGVTATAAEINLIDGGTARGTTAIADGDGVLINDAGTMRMTNVTTVKTYMGGDNTPAFSAVIAADQSISAATWTKVVFGTEDLDSDGKFASNAFTPTVAGWYWCHTSQYYELSDAGEANRVKFYKNGSGLAMHGTVMRSADTDQDMILEANALIYLDGDDYLEVFINSADGVTLASTNSHVFSAFRMTGV